MAPRPCPSPSLSLDHGKAPTPAGSSWSTSSTSSKTPPPYQGTPATCLVLGPCQPVLSLSLCLLTWPLLLSGRRGPPGGGPGQWGPARSRVLLRLLPAGPHTPLQLTVLGSALGDLGPKVRGPAGLPGFALGAWSMGWGRLGVSVGSRLAWTGDQTRVRGAGSCWWPWRTWHRLQSKWVRVSPYGRRGRRPVQPASSGAECSLPGAPSLSSSLGSCTL